MLPILSRRRFVLTAAAAAGATWFDVPRLLADTRKQSLDRFGGFAFGLQSFTLRKLSVEQVVETIHRKLDLHYVEFTRHHFPIDSNPEQIRQMLDLLGRHEMSISAHGVNRFGEDREANRALFRLAQAAGIRNISANPLPESFDSLDKLCGEFPEVRIAIHNHGPTALYNKISDVVDAVRDRHPNIGACVDTGHFIRSAEDPIKAIHELKGRVFGIHVKDMARQEQKGDEVVIGKGLLDLEAMFKAMHDVKFPADGALSLEFEGNPDDPIPEVQECLKAASEAARKVARG